MLVCQGRMGFRTGMGQGLYASEGVFRETVDRCARVVEDRTGIDLAPGFQDSAVAATVHASEFRSILTHGLLHIGLIELWRSKGVVPDGVIGLSLGEITAAVAAGMLTPEQAITVVQAAAQWDERLAGRGKLVMTDLTRSGAEELRRTAGMSVECIAEYGPRALVLFCVADDVPALTAVLDRRGVRYHVHAGDYAYHTARFADCRSLLSGELAALEPAAPAIPFYSGMSGGRVPSSVLADGLYWYRMLASPVWFGTAFRQALRDGFGVMLNIGPHPTLAADLDRSAAAARVRPIFLDSLRDDASEERCFARTFDRLRSLGFVRRPPVSRAALRPEAVDLTSAEALRDPVPLLAGLRAQSPVHWLARHGFWLVLGADEVAQAIAAPELFTSAPAEGLDPILLAAGPETHGRAHRPLAKAMVAALSGAEARIATLADDGLDRLETTVPADLVADFASPLAQRSAAAFIGLTRAETQAVQSIVGATGHDLGYLPALRDWFGRYATQAPDPGSLLARLISGDAALLAEEAASVLTLVWVAGTTTTAMLIASAAWEWLHQPALRLELIDHPGRTAELVEETLRLHPPEQTLWRRTSAEAVLGGVAIPAGAEVRLSLAAANRDPSLHPRPDMFDLARREPHLAFGAGLHHCIGGGLARVSARVALTRLIARFPNARAVESVSRSTFLASDHFRGLATLPVALNGALDE